MQYIYGDPRDPLQKILYTIQQGGMPHQGHPPKEMLDHPLFEEQMREQINLMKVQTASVVADIRQRDSELFRNLLAELRMAMSNYKISEGDKGGEGRPPMDSSFDEINIGKLQECYLNVTMRYIKYIDHISVTDLGFEPPNGIQDKKNKKQKPE